MTNFLTKGLYLALESHRMLSLETSETTGMQQQKKGEFLIASNLDNVQTNSPARIYGNDPSKSLTYKAPDPLLPSPVSVSQDTTIETCSKGKQTFPLKVHYPNLVFHSKIIPNTIGNVLELREE